MAPKRRRKLGNVTRARQLRRDATYPEQLLWSQLRARRLAGVKFRRQHPIGRYVVDFCCVDARLVVELDGDTHNDRAIQDAQRTTWLESQGWRVFRVDNDDVLADIDAVLEAILTQCGVDPGGAAPSKT